MVGGGDGTEAGSCGEGVELCGRISGVWGAVSKGRGEWVRLLWCSCL